MTHLQFLWRFPIYISRFPIDKKLLAGAKSQNRQTAIGNPTGGRMALKVSKAQVWAGALMDQPGGLAKVLGELAKSGTSVEFIIARRDDKQTGRGKVFITPLKGKKGMDAA